MKKLTCLILVCAMMELHGQAAPASTDESGIRLTIELRDGSRVVGKNLEDTYGFSSSLFGDSKLAWADIRAVEFTDTPDTARLTAANGDAFAIKPTADVLRVETSFGKTELPVKLIRCIKVSKVGKLGLPPGLVALWSGDGNGDDSAGGHTADVPPGIAYAPGKVGQGFSFDGQEHRIVVPNAPELNFGVNQDFSITAWIQPQESNTTSGVLSIVDKRSLSFNPVSGYVNPASGYELSLENGRIHTRIWGAPFGPAGPDLRDGLFHHVAVTVLRNSPEGGHLYADGRPVLTFDTTALKGDLSTDQPLRIGNNADSNFNSCFKGIINQVAIYNRALSDLEIQTICKEENNGELPPPPATPGFPGVRLLSPPLITQ